MPAEKPLESPAGRLDTISRLLISLAEGLRLLGSRRGERGLSGVVGSKVFREGSRWSAHLTSREKTKTKRSQRRWRRRLGGRDQLSCDCG